MTTPQSADVRRVARNFSALVIGSVLSKGVLFAWQILLGNAILPQEYGVYNTVFALMAISAMVTSGGFGLIVVREGARDPHRLPLYWATSLFLQTCLFLPAYVGMVAFALASGYSETIVAYSALAGLSMLIDVFGNVGYDVLIAREQMHITSALEIVAILLRVGLSGVALAFGWGLLGVYGATLLAGVARSCALTWANVRDGLRPRFPLERALILSLVLNSLPLMMAGFLSLAYQHADKLMTTAILGERNTGYLAPAFLINFGMIEIISTTLLVAVYPMLSRYYHDDALRPAFGTLTHTLARFMLMASLPLVLALSLFAPQVIATLYNDSYAPTAGILAVLVWYTLLTMVGNVFSKSLLIQNRQRLTLAIRAFSLLMNVALNALLLFQTRDARGAAIASVLAEAFATGAMLWAFRAEGFDRRAFAVAVARVLGAGAVGAGAMLVVGGVHFVAGAIVGGLAYAGALVAFGAFSAWDVALLRQLGASLPVVGRAFR
jgi:O-antigen/teichoic acid export membrane protein